MTTVSDSSSKVLPLGIIDKLFIIFKIFRKGKMLFHGWCKLFNVASYGHLLENCAKKEKGIYAKRVISGHEIKAKGLEYTLYLTPHHSQYFSLAISCTAVPLTKFLEQVQCMEAGRLMGDNAQPGLPFASRSIYKVNVGWFLYLTIFSEIESISAWKLNLKYRCIYFCFKF